MDAGVHGEPRVIAERPTLHILRVPMREVSRRLDGKERWCFYCRRRVEFERVITTPVDPMSYYGPSARVECVPRGHMDGDLFPGWSREWSDTNTDDEEETCGDPCGDP